MGLSFTIAAGPRQRILRSESRGINGHILLSQIRDFPNLEGQVPILISPRNRVAQLYPQALGSLSFASYHSTGPRLHKRVKIAYFRINYIMCIWYDKDRIENTARNSVAWYVLVAAGTSLPSRCQTTMWRHTKQGALINLLLFYFKIRKRGRNITVYFHILSVVRSTYSRMTAGHNSCAVLRRLHITRARVTHCARE
jgi:hypothetical protein